MKVGLLVTGDLAVRAAHSLAAHPGIDEVVVIGPAKSKSFEVVRDAKSCDLLVGSGIDAPAKARKHAVPLIWDGAAAEAGVAVWGASPEGLALSLASRESDPRVVALAHPTADSVSSGRKTRFPDPVGSVQVADTIFGERPLAVGKSPNDFAACLAVGADRRVAIVDSGAFMSGIALAAGIAAYEPDMSRPVWEEALPYLDDVVSMGLVLAEST